MKRVRGLLAVCSAVMLLGAACKSSPSTSSPSSSPSAAVAPSPTSGITLKLSSDATATAVAGNTATLALNVTGVRIVKTDGDTSGQTGHFHVFIDQDPVAVGEIIPKAAGIVHTADNPIKLTGLSDGTHKVTVVLGDGVHRRISDAQVQTSITITGPSVHLNGPATATAGKAITVTATAESVTLTAAASDTSKKDGTKGHLHILVNKDPFPAGAPIPSGDPAIIHTAVTATVIPANLLKLGDNTIWLELGYADHSPFDPMILDKIVVTVTPAASPSSSPRVTTTASPRPTPSRSASSSPTPRATATP